MRTNFIAHCAAFAACCLLSLPAFSQEPADTHTTIRSESRLVLVDSVVTDKKGNYIHDLTQKDFKVWEDNKEQPITTFSFEAGPAAPSNPRKHYLVLFFDNSTASLTDQVYARKAATSFVESNAGPNRLMAIVEFGGSVRVTQNFTDDADRLKKVLSGVKFSTTAPNAGGPSVFTNYSVRSVLGALRNMAKGLSDVPGRKTLVFLSKGFRLDQEDLSELSATIDACNRANVAIYPIDVGGLAAPQGRLLPAFPGVPSLAMLQASLMANPFLFQAKPAPGGGSAGGSTGGSGGSRVPSNPGGTGTRGGTAPVTGPTTGNTGGTGARGGTGTPTGGGNTNNNGAFNNRFPGMNPNSQNQMRSIIPPPLRSATANQSVLYSLASGTGGFVIVNTNDLLAGLEKIGREQNEYYVLGYTPTKEPDPGSCHTLKVKVDRGGTEIRSRTGYCEAKSVDVLAGTPTERELETRLGGNAVPTVKATMQAPFFYISPNTARVDVAVDVPAGALKFAKDKGKLKSVMNVVGIAYLADGGVAARFSDSVRLSFDEKKDMEAFQEKPFHYEKQFEMASGKYNLKVAFSSGPDSFGKLEKPLDIEPWDATQFFISAIAFSKDVRPSAEMAAGLDAELLENRTPLIVNGVQVTPAGTSRFSKTDKGFVYAEMYEPSLTTPDLKEAPVMGIKVQIVDGKTGAIKQDLGGARVSPPGLTGNPAVPVGLRLPIADLGAGEYRVQVTALDAAGHQVTRAANFEIE